MSAQSHHQDEKQQEQHVWYCSYGSNCNLDRFNVYLCGGKPQGSGSNAPSISGARVSSPPLSSEGILLKNYEMIFSRVSRTWHGGGVCFIRKNQKGNSFEIYNHKEHSSLFDGANNTHQEFNNLVLGRIHKILYSQFVDVVSQENGHVECHSKGGNAVQQKLDNQFNEIVGKCLEQEEKTGVAEYKLFNTWYGNIVLVGIHPVDGCPIISFTTSCFSDEIVNKAHVSYLKTVGSGIMECFNLNIAQCANYFLSKEGVKGFYTQEELANSLNK
ncbi:hypothetical protein NAEGRDRAFT_78743 [Naegleria gruberi]|uniref:Uncharacterized protein n=1 Tax=Naegleria gruberi TaxID=5762 RepID=D2V657_NAEGR|nr:uncharacterized protein NAEGRDRAFT_78743 [Naegleria gruberi]EFC47907.1 hypothetical protein NAEGRDRAFT_78743 [Naegleria gruberi]|eukprot:XP_002680651.1 hypothetical protein NAEGRDRAFT_78743 [Naegleria gruberi strain NEG-M]